MTALQPDLAEDHIVVTTTTANAVSVYRHMEFVRQCLLSGHGCTADFHHRGLGAIRCSRTQLAQAACKRSSTRNSIISNEAFPFHGLRQCYGLRRLASAAVPDIVLGRASLSKLRSHPDTETRLMRRLMAESEEFKVIPYGTEALGVMRVEKGHAAGNELNGTTTARNLGHGQDGVKEEGQYRLNICRSVKPWSNRMCCDLSESRPVATRGQRLPRAGTLMNVDRPSRCGAMIKAT